MERRPDRRVTKTRKSLMSAFTRLMFERGYENFTVADIVDSANVGRSTFYAHFTDREDILRECMARFFAVIASTVSAEIIPAQLTGVLEHLMQNRRLIDVIFTGRPRIVLFKAMGSLVRTNLDLVAKPGSWLLSPVLISAQISDAQMTLVESWLRGRAHASSDAMAEAIHRSTRAMVQSMQVEIHPAAQQN